MSDITLQYPWLLLLALQPFLLMVIRYLSGQKCVNAYASSHLRDWVTTRKAISLRGQLLSRNSAYIIAWLLFAIAAAGPRTVAETPGVVTSTGTDIMIVLDISRSMHTGDLKPSRLRYTKNKLETLTTQIQNERVGIIVFAGKAHLYVPMTRDIQALEYYIKNIDSLIPPSQGSRPGIALKLAYNEFSKLAVNNPGRNHAIVLMSDGDLEIKGGLNKRAPEFSELIRSANIPLYTIGFGTHEGDAVPDNTSGWITHNNQPVISRLNTELLRGFSTLTGGKYFKARQNDNALQTILDDTRQRAYSKHNGEAGTSTEWNELYSLFLLPGILLFFISFNPYSLHLPVITFFEKSKHIVTTSIVFVAITLVTFHPIQGNAENPAIKQAYDALINNDYATAMQLYSKIEGYAGRFGEGVVSYQLEEYPRAIRFFSQAVLGGKTDQQRGRALYNLGNSLFQVGNYAEAIQSYQDALRYAPANTSARNNLVYADKVKTAVDERQRILAITKRAGRGPREGAIAEGIELNESNKVSIDDSSDDPNKPSPGIDTHNLDIPEVLILKGLDYAAKESDSQNLDPGTAFHSVQRKLTINTLNQLHDNQAMLWKRIFELEEGYPAPLDTPVILPGVAAW